MTRSARGLALLVAGALALSAAPALGQDAAPSPEAEVDVGGTLLRLSPDGGTPAAGRYADDSLDIELEFTLSDEWVYGSSAPGFGIDLAIDGEGEPLFTFSEVNRALLERPCETEGDETYWQDLADIELDAASVIGHFASNPYLQNEGPTPVTVSGIEGLQLDVLVAKGRRCIHPEIPLWTSSYGEAETDYYIYTLYDGINARIIALEVDGKTVLIVMEAQGDTYDTLLDVGMPVVESMSITAAGDGSA